MTARPIRFRRGWWNFFTDETGFIRFTEENRLATAKDPPLQG